MGQLILNKYESRTKKYSSVEKLNTTDNSPFLRFGTQSKINNNGNVIIGFGTIIGTNHYEVCVKNTLTNRYENFIVNSSTLSAFSNKKLSNVFCLSNDGRYLFIAIESENYILGIDTQTKIVSRVIESQIPAENITNMVTDEQGTTLLISTNSSLYIYHKNDFDDDYTLFFESQTPDFIGSSYKMNSDGRRIVIARPTWNESRGEVVVIRQNHSTGYGVFTKIQNKNGKEGDQFGSSIDITSDAERILQLHLLMQKLEQMLVRLQYLIWNII